MGVFKVSFPPLKTNKKFIVFVVVTLSIIPAAIFYFLGVSVGKSQLQKTSQLPQNSNLENELRLCLENKASMTAPMDDGTYNFATFRVYSPLLEDKTVSKQEFTYKRALIALRTIEINKDIQIKTWVLEKPTDYLPPLPERLAKKLYSYDLSYALYNFPIVDGYEFIDIINDDKLVSSKIPENPKPSDTYLSKKGIKMYRKSEYGSKVLSSGAELDFYANVNGGKTQVFGQIIFDLNKMNMNQDITIKDIVKVFHELESIADTISFEKYQ